MNEYKGFTNDELSAELESRGLHTSGNKDELVTRLEADDAGGPEPESETTEPDAPEATVTEAGPENKPDDDGFLGVSSENKHKPASVHFSPTPSTFSSDDDSES